MTDISDAVEILKRAREQQCLKAVSNREAVTSITPSKNPPVYSLVAKSGKVVAMMDDSKNKDGKVVIAEIRSNRPSESGTS